MNYKLTMITVLSEERRMTDPISDITKRSRSARATIMFALVFLLFAAHARAAFLYVLQDNNGASNQIRGFSINATTGDLTALSGFPVTSGGQGDGIPATQRMAYDFVNDRLYVLNAGSNTVSAFSVNTTTGALTALTHSPFTVVASPTGNERLTCLAVHPIAGAVLVVGDGQGDVYSFRVSSTTATEAASSPFTTGDARSFSMAFTQNGAFLYTGGDSNDDIAGFVVNPVTAALTAVSGSPFTASGDFPVGLATDLAGRVFSASAQSGNVEAFNNTVGVLSEVAANPFNAAFVQPRHGVLHPAGFYMVADAGANQIGVFQIAGAASATTLTEVADSPFNCDATTTNILTIDETGQFVYAAHAVTRNLVRFTINSTNGSLSARDTQAVNTLGTNGFITGMTISEPLEGAIVEAVSPSRVRLTGGVTVTLIGRGLNILGDVEVGGMAVTNLNIESTTTATFTAPANTVGAKDITTTVFGTTVTLASAALRYVGEVTRTVTVDAGSEQADFKMIGIPLSGGGTQSAGNANSVTRLNRDSTLFAQLLAAADVTDNTVARIFRFNGTTYDEGTDIPLDDLGEGIGFWGIFANGLSLSATGGNTNQFEVQIDGTVVPTPPIAVFMHPGWNQVSPGVAGRMVNPANVFVTDGVNTFSVTDSSNTLTNREFFEFTNNLTTPYVAASVLDGEDGYWLFNFSESTVLLSFGSFEANTSEQQSETNAFTSVGLTRLRQTDLSSTSLPASVKYQLTGNAEGVTRAVDASEALSPPAPPGGLASSSSSGGGGGGGCFIATASYGTKLDGRIRLLSRFRDVSLIPSEPGKAFTGTYYNNSPSAANFLRKSRTLRAVARRLLLPVVNSCEK
jgi:6-phosphogluconolactonase